MLLEGETRSFATNLKQFTNCCAQSVWLSISSHTHKKKFLCASFVPFSSLTLDQKSAPKCLMVFYSDTLARAAVPYLTHKGNINHCRFKSLPVTHASTTLFLLFQKKSEKKKKDTFFFSTKGRFCAAARLESQIGPWGVSCWMKSWVCCALSGNRVGQTARIKATDTAAI